VLVLDLHSSFFFTGPVIFLRIFLSNTANIFVSFAPRLQVSAAHQITGRTRVRCILSLVFRDCVLNFKMGHQASQQRLPTYNHSPVSMFVSSYIYVSKAPISFKILSLSMWLPRISIYFDFYHLLSKRDAFTYLVGWSVG
jgi:hypothetical protein